MTSRNQYVIDTTVHLQFDCDGMHKTCISSRQIKSQHGGRQSKNVVGATGVDSCHKGRGSFPLWCELYSTLTVLYNRFYTLK